MKKKNTVQHGVYRGDVWYADIEKNEANEDVHNGERVIIIVSSWRNNIKNSRVNAICCSTQNITKEKNILTLDINGKMNTILCSNIVTLSKKKLINKIAEISKEDMEQIDDLLRKQLQLEIFDIKKVRKLAEGIKNIEKFISENKLEDNGELNLSMCVQREELENYCKKFNEDVRDYLNANII